MESDSCLSALTQKACPALKGTLHRLTLERPKGHRAFSRASPMTCILPMAGAPWLVWAPRPASLGSARPAAGITSHSPGKRTEPAAGSVRCFLCKQKVERSLSKVARGERSAAPNRDHGFRHIVVSMCLKSSSWTKPNTGQGAATPRASSPPLTHRRKHG